MVTVQRTVFGSTSNIVHGIRLLGEGAASAQKAKCPQGTNYARIFRKADAMSKHPVATVAPIIAACLA